MTQSPELPATSTAAPLLEREAQVAAVVALVEAALGGDGRLVVIEGSAGIGKTRLVGAARSIAADAGMRPLVGRGGELERDFPIGVVRQLFEPLLAGSTPEQRAELLAGAAALAEPLFDPSQLAASPEATGERSFPMLHGLYWLAANTALQQPTLLVVDDAHWADAFSLRWLLYLARRLEGLPLLVAVATRPPDAEGRESTLLAELVAAPDAVGIRPGPLGRSSIEVLARELHGLEADDIFCGALEDATGGNPLFVGAILDTVSRDGLSPTAASAPRLLDLGAQGVSRAIGLRLSRLAPEALSLLRAAAVLGDGTELRHVGTLADIEPEVLGAAASTLVRLQLLRHADPVEFFHPVVRSAVYETLDPVERGRAHRRAAEILVEAGGRPESAATHLLLTPLDADRFVVSTLRRAAERSLAQGAADAAVGYLTRAVEERSEPAVHAEALVELGLAERHTNGPAAAEHLQAGLELLDDPARRGHIALELGRALWFSGQEADALSIFDRALGELDAKRNPDLNELLLAELISSAWWVPETYPIAEARIAKLDLDALHGGFGSDVLRATMAHYEYRRGRDRDRALDLARRSLASGKLLASGAVAFSYAGYAFPLAGLFDEALVLYEQALAQARSRGDIFHVGSMLMWRGRCQTLRGDLPAAVADLEEAMELSLQHGVVVSRPYLVGFLAQALLERGETDEAARVVAEGDFPERPPVNLHLNFFRLTRARLRIETGQAERGVEELLEIGESARRVPFENPALAPWRSWAAEGLRLLERADEAHALADEELTLARRWGAPHAIGAALRTLGLIEDGQTAVIRLQEAVTVLAESQARLEHARALVDLGAALRRANERRESRQHLRQGIDLAYRCGGTTLIERANDELAATGAHRRTILLTGLDSLTASERRVAQLAADGLSNKEIAQTLFVAVKTVEVHLSRAFRKLNINSRNQLARALTGAP